MENEKEFKQVVDALNFIFDLAKSSPADGDKHEHRKVCMHLIINYLNAVTQELKELKEPKKDEEKK